MRVRVYIEDTDAGGVVFYANYLRYLERARTEALRAAGVDLVEWQARHRRLFVVRRVRVDYLVPARLDDELTVHAQIRTLSRASLTLEQPIERVGARVADAEVTLACIDADSLRPVRIPAPLAAALAPSGASAVVNADLSFIELVLNASPVVQGVMLILVIASVLSWALILGKSIQLRRARRAAEDFEQDFWGSSDISGTYSKLTMRRGTLAGLERIFEAGFSEFGRLRRKTSNDEIIMDGSGRAMRIAVSREADIIEQNLPFLATVGSISPYVGLFGTVWGIMNSFTALGNVQQATLQMVAPGIAEALIATAIGLFAAIPAVVFYNRFATDVDRLMNRYENFSEEFSTVLQRQAIRRTAQQEAEAA